MMQAKEKIPLWLQPAPVLTIKPRLQYRGEDGDSLETYTEETAFNVSIRTLLQIEDNGYCLWKLVRSNGLVICICRDKDEERIPPGYPCFTIEEMGIEELEFSRLVCYTKLHGAVVDSVKLIPEKLS